MGNNIKKNKLNTYIKNDIEYCSNCNNEIIDVDYCKICWYRNNIKYDKCEACHLIIKNSSRYIYHPYLHKLVLVHDSCHKVFVK
jgi:hypothetical protein